MSRTSIKSSISGTYIFSLWFLAVLRAFGSWTDSFWTSHVHINDFKLCLYGNFSPHLSKKSVRTHTESTRYKTTNENLAYTKVNILWSSEICFKRFLLKVMSDLYACINFATVTARKIGFTLNLILIIVEVKYDYRFDLNFDARQMCVKNVMALPIHLILDKEESKCDLNFDSTFEARQRENQISWCICHAFDPCQRRG